MLTTNTVAAAILLPKFGSTLDCIGGEGLCSQEGFVGASVLHVGEWMLLPVCLGISHGCDFRGSYSLSHGFPAVFWLKVDGNLWGNFDFSFFCKWFIFYCLKDSSLPLVFFSLTINKICCSLGYFLSEFPGKQYPLQICQSGVVHHYYLRAISWVLSLKALCRPHVGFLPSGKSVFLILNFLRTSSILISFSLNCLFFLKLFLAVLGVHWWVWAFFSFSSVVSGGYSLLKCVVFSLQQLLLLQSSGSGAQRASVAVACVGLLGPLYVGILVLRSGMEPKSPALAGEFLTMGPPGKSLLIVFSIYI